MIEAVELLCSRGHDINDLLYKYPSKLVLEFHKAALKNVKLNVKQLAYSFRAAMHAKDKDFKDYFSDLKMDLQSKQKKQRKPTKAEVNQVKNLLGGK